MRVDYPEEVDRRDYLIDGNEIGENCEQQFHFWFETTDYTAVRCKARQAPLRPIPEDD